MAARLIYPPVPRIAHIDTYRSKINGTVPVEDPYRQLEVKGPHVDDFVQGKSAPCSGDVPCR
jgi:hypothetical protein